MGLGLTVYNDSNTLQIDASYRNFLLVSKKYYATNNSRINQSGDIFAFSGVGYLLDESVFGSGWVYGFSLINAKPNDLGLEVYDEDGKLCFSSESKPMRVLEMLNNSYFSDAKPFISRSYGVSQCAVITGQPYLSWREGSNYKIGVFDIDTLTALKLNPLPIISTNKYTYDHTDLSRYMGEYNYLVIDVSHY